MSPEEGGFPEEAVAATLDNVLRESFQDSVVDGWATKVDACASALSDFADGRHMLVFHGEFNWGFVEKARVSTLHTASFGDEESVQIMGYISPDYIMEIVIDDYA